MKLAAVIIETKTDLNYTANAIAQLMGYYLRACKKEADEQCCNIVNRVKSTPPPIPFYNWLCKLCQCCLATVDRIFRK